MRDSSKNAVAYLGVGYGYDYGERGLATRIEGLVQSMDISPMRTVRGLSDLVRAESRLRATMEMSRVVLLPLTFPPMPDGCTHEQKIAIARIADLELEIASELEKHRGGQEMEFSKLSASDRVDTGIRRFVPVDRYPLIHGPEDHEVNSLLLTRIGSLVSGHPSTPGQVATAFANEEELILKSVTQLVRTIDTARPKVMLSSTWQDLKDVRDRIKILLHQLGYPPPLMFELETQTANPLAASLELVGQCTTYLGLLYATYGQITDSGCSLTEHEYDESLRLGKPRAFLLQYPLEDLPASIAELRAKQTPAQIKRLDALKRRCLKEQHFNFRFSDLDEPEWGVLDLLLHLLRPGLDAVAAPPPVWPDPYIAHPYSLVEDDQITLRRDIFGTLDIWHQSRDEKPIFFIAALGGMGKSALAWKWMHRDTDGRRGAWLWWSFYAPQAETRSFILKLYEWLHRGASAPSYLDDRGLVDLVVSKLHRNATDTTLVLDGIERELKFYKLHPLAKEHEGPDLEDQIRTAAVNASKGGESPGDIERGLLSFADGTDSWRYNSEKSMLTYFLKKCAALGTVKVLATTRLIPTDVEALIDEAGTLLCETMQLPGLRPDQIRQLWMDLGGTWDDSPLPESLGGFTLEELCCNVLEGYALPVALLAARVLECGGFPEWKRGLPKWQAEEDWRSAATKTMSASEYVSALITMDTYESLSGEEKQVLHWILDRSEPIHYTDLQRKWREAHAKSPFSSSLRQCLDSLRRKRLVGRNVHHLVYEIHPRVRHAAKLCDADNSSTCARRRELFENKYSFLTSAPDDEFVPAQTIEQMLADLQDFIDSRAYVNATDLYRTHIERFLRFRVKVEVPQLRASLLDTLIGRLRDECDRRVRIASPEQEGDVRNEFTEPLLWLLTYKLDNDQLLCRYEPPITLNALLESSPVSAARSFAVYHWAVHCESECRYHDALTSLVESLSSGAADDDTRRWAICHLIHMLCGMRAFGFAEKALRPLSPVSDADSLYARAMHAISTNSAHQASAVTEYVRSTTGLVLGSAYSYLVQAIYHVRSKGTSVGLDSIFLEGQRFADVHGFVSVAVELQLLKAEYYLNTDRLAEASAIISSLESETCISGSRLHAAKLELLRSLLSYKNADLSSARTAMIHALEIGDVYNPMCTLRDHFYQHNETISALSLEPISETDLALLRAQLSVISDHFKGTSSTYLPTGITNTRGWTEEQITEALTIAEVRLGFDPESQESRHKWWSAFRSENLHRLGLVFRLAEEILIRGRNLEDFFLAYVYSNSDNILANLEFMDFRTRRSALEHGATSSTAGALLELMEPRLNYPDPTFRSDSDLLKDRDDLLTELRHNVEGSFGYDSDEVWERVKLRLSSLKGQVRFLQELTWMKCTLGEFANAEVVSGQDDIIATLSFLRYLRIKRQEDERRHRQTLGLDREL